jgi:hypothetical protein
MSGLEVCQRNFVQQEHVTVLIAECITVREQLTSKVSFLMIQDWLNVANNECQVVCREEVTCSEQKPWASQKSRLGLQ